MNILNQTYEIGFITSGLSPNQICGKEGLNRDRARPRIVLSPSFAAGFSSEDEYLKSDI
jgi:hypothetical protein